MSKSNNIVSKPAKTTTGSAAMKAVTALLLAGKSMIQSINVFEQEVQKTALKCLEHAETHGDVMPMDRLVKGLLELNHPATTRLSQEVISWARSVSPIRWNSKGEAKQLKEGDEGFKPYDVLSGNETPFYETATAKRARQAADAAHKRTLQPVTMKDVLNRARGILKFIENANEADRNGEVRGIAKGEGTKIKKFASKMQEFLVENGMPEEEAKAA